MSIGCLRLVMQSECGTRILRVVHGQDARATWQIVVTLNISLLAELMNCQGTLVL